MVLESAKSTVLLPSMSFGPQVALEALFALPLFRCFDLEACMGRPSREGLGLDSLRLVDGRRSGLVRQSFDMPSCRPCLFNLLLGGAYLPEMIIPQVRSDQSAVFRSSAAGWVHWSIQLFCRDSGVLSQ